MASVTLHGNPFNTVGELPAAGATAPDFKLTDKDLADVTLANFAGKKKLLNIVPSLDTPTCAISTEKFNQHAAAHTDTVVLVVSADLPFAMERFCGQKSLDNVVNLSMMRDKIFGETYGVLMADGPLAGLTARAVVVLDEHNTVLYTQLVGEIGHEPDYQAALAALRSA